LSLTVLRSAARRRVRAVSAQPFADEAALLSAAHALSGYTVAELAHAVGRDVSAQACRDKGCVGRVAELALGLRCVGKPQAVADFAELGVELKTLPVTPQRRPRESTFVCYAPLEQLLELPWEQSRVGRKLARVLFWPVESDPRVPLGQRRFGRAFLWSASAAQAALLRADYAEFARQLLLGHAESLDARLGKALQLRPKAAHGRVRVRGLDADGAPFRMTPRGFYLRASFTHGILREAFAETVA
jgi:DNA mismatch repair protein MutH